MPRLRLSFHTSDIGTRRTLQIGFGGLLLLIALALLAQLLLLKRSRDADAAARSEYFARVKALGDIRDAIFLSGTFARDYLLSPDPKRAASLRDEVHKNQERAKAALAAYPESADPENQRLLSDLNGEINVYWKVVDLMLDVAPRERRAGTDEYFYQSLVNRRETMFGIASRISEVGENEWQQRESQAQQRDRTFWYTMLAIGVLTIGLAVGLAVVTASHLVQLERESAERLAETTIARQELGELSAKLVNAQEEERRAISRELHDEVGQSLTALIVEAGNTGAGLPPDAGEARGRLEAMRGIAQKCLAAVRNMALLLRPSMLDDFGLVPALEWQAREVSKRTGLRVHVDADDDAGDLPDEHRTCIYRVAQEALHNCTKHSAASAARITLRQSATAVTLTIQDDGHGFDSARTRGLGLLGMQERVARLRGTFEVDSAPGKGTLVTIMLPMLANNPAHSGKANV